MKSKIVKRAACGIVLSLSGMSGGLCSVYRPLADSDTRKVCCDYSLQISVLSWVCVEQASQSENVNDTDRDMMIPSLYPNPPLFQFVPAISGFPFFPRTRLRGPCHLKKRVFRSVTALLSKINIRSNIIFCSRCRL